MISLLQIHVVHQISSSGYGLLNGYKYIIPYHFGNNTHQGYRSVMLNEAFVSFLMKRMMFESFHSSGRIPCSNDLLKRHVNDGAILFAHSFNKRIGILSGPEALLGSRLYRTWNTSFGSKTIYVTDNFV